MKLVVSDLDGTLLFRGEKEIGKVSANAIDYILSEGAAFAVASGRSYVELKHLLSRWENEIYFFPSDGAIGIYRGETLFSDPVGAFSSDEFAAHGKYAVYLKSENLPLIRKYMSSYRNHVVRISDFSEIDAPVYKIADYTHKGDNGLSAVYKSREMTEYVMQNVNKARAAKKLMSLLDISEENIIAFGDGENDLELFKSSGTACAVSSAPPKIKKEADITADFNEETLKKFILK